MRDSFKVIAASLVAALVLAGCGAAENVEEKAPVETVEEAKETPTAEETEEAAGEAVETPTAEETVEETAEDLVPDPTNLTYLEEYQIEDFYGDGKEYPLYAPKGGDNEDGFFFYDEHGVHFTASVYNCEYPEYASEFLPMYLDETVKSKVSIWQEDEECFDIGVGETLEKGDDRYLFLTAKREDFYGAVYQKRMLVYMSVRDGGVGVYWDMELSENEQDEETASLIAEIARCYGLNLSEFGMEDGTWAEQDAELKAERQNDYKPEEGEPVLEKVEGYKYLGMATIAMDNDGEVTCPVLAPMGLTTSVYDNRVLTTMHGVSVWVRGYQTPNVRNYQAMAQDSADRNLRYYNDEESGYRNAKVSDIMLMQGQDAAVYYVVEFEEKDRKTEDYHKRTYINCLIQMKEKHYVACEITLRSEDYDGETNALLKELETAYGLDLSAWYAEE